MVFIIQVKVIIFILAVIIIQILKNFLWYSCFFVTKIQDVEESGKISFDKSGKIFEKETEI